VIVEIRFLRKTVSPYSSTTLKIVDVSPMMWASDNTYTPTSAEDSLRWYEAAESEKVVGSNAPTFKERTSSLEGSESKAGVSDRVREHKQLLSSVIAHTPFPHVLFRLG
jgi:hypothetical protein